MRKIHLQQLLQEIEQLAKQGKWSEVDHALQQARSFFPKQPVVWFGMGNSAYQQGNLKLARENWLKASKLAPTDLNISFMLINCLREMEHDKEELKELKRVLQLFPGQPLARLKLAENHARAGDKKNAVQLYNDLLKEFPCQSSAWNGLSVLGELNPKKHLTKIESCIDDQDNSEFDRITLHYVAGRLYEKQQDYQKSWDAFLYANTQSRKAVGLDFSTRSMAARTVIQDMTGDKVAGIVSERNPSKAPIFIVGMPRSGTTLLERMLGSHPDIEGLGEKKTMGISLKHAIEKLPAGISPIEGIDKSHFQAWKKIGEKYLSDLSGSRGKAKYFIDKMPLNANLAGLIHLVFPEATIIYCRRKPEDVAISCLSLAFEESHLKFTPEELGELIGIQEALMEHWIKILPKESIHVVDYEKLVVKPEEMLEPLLKNIGLPWSSKCLQFNQNKGNVRTASLAQVRRKLYTSSVGRGKRFGDLLKPVMDARAKTKASLLS